MHVCAYGSGTCVLMYVYELRIRRGCIARCELSVSSGPS